MKINNHIISALRYEKDGDRHRSDRHMKRAMELAFGKCEDCEEFEKKMKKSEEKLKESENKLKESRRKLELAERDLEKQKAHYNVQINEAFKRNVIFRNEFLEQKRRESDNHNKKYDELQSERDIWKTKYNECEKSLKIQHDELSTKFARP